jgi:hypothetical protein
MGLWKKVKKVAKKVGKVAKKVTAVSLAATGNPLGMKAAAKVSKSMGMKKGGGKSALKLSAQVARGTGKVAQIAGTAAATIFGSPVLGAAVYRMGALNKQLIDREAQLAKGLKAHKVNWGKQAIRGVTTVGGAFAVGGAASLLGGGSMLGGVTSSGLSIGQGLLGKLGIGGSQTGISQSDYGAEAGGDAWNAEQAGAGGAYPETSGNFLDDLGGFGKDVGLRLLGKDWTGGSGGAGEEGGGGGGLLDFLGGGGSGGEAGAGGLGGAGGEAGAGEAGSSILPVLLIGGAALAAVFFLRR